MMVRMAEMEIEPSYLEAYKQILKEEAAAYQAHLQTPHFLHYKTSTLKMVKSLKLVEMSALDSESMAACKQE